MDIIKTGSLADMVFDKLETSILSGEYSAGEILTELSLSQQLNVSRTPVREAIRRLQQENLVKEVGKGVKVVGVSISDLEDIFEIRSRVEGLAAKKCAEKITQKQISELEEIVELQEFYTAKKIADSIKNADTEFHKKIYEVCGSEIYSSMLSDLHKRVQKFRKISVENSGRAINAQKEHREIFEAIKAKNGELAEKLTVQHITNAKESIMKSIVSEE